MNEQIAFLGEVVGFAPISPCPRCGCTPDIIYSTYTNTSSYQHCSYVADSREEWESICAMNEGWGTIDDVGKPVWLIEIKNLKHSKPKEPFDFYIDRRTPLGNPFPLNEEAQRDHVCNLYDEYFKNRVELGDQEVLACLDLMERALEVHGRLRLYCHCAPRRCHGETIKQWLLRNK